MAEIVFIVLGGLKYGAIYALAGLGLVVVHKATQIVNFAHGGYIMLGAYTTYFLLDAFRLPYWLIYIACALFVGLAAMAIEWLILRPIRRADMFTVVIATVFLAVVLQETIRLPYTVEILPLPPLFDGPPLVWGPAIVAPEALWIICGTLVAAAVSIFIFNRAAIGRSMRAMAANIRGAQLCGYSIDRTYAAAWFFGGVLAGLAGAFGAPSLGVSPALMVMTIVPAFVAAVIGGFDSLIGTVIGGLLLGIVENFAAAYVSGGMKSAVSFVILFLVLMLRPEGLFTEAAGRRV